MSEVGASPLLEVRGLRKQFGDHLVLDSVDLAVPRRSIVSLFGRSGTGKSVLLKCLAGLLAPDAGKIRFDRESLGDARMRCSYLFQSNALFDSLSALENVALPLEQTTRMKRTEIEQASLRALKNLGLEKFTGHFPAQLSGGMQKRLALARALVTQPQMVLFDEPTAGLDPPARTAVFEMIVQYRHQFGFTAVVVTHDVAEALAASDRIALLEDGRIRFEGTPAEFSAADNCIVRSFGDNSVTIRPGFEK
ncbi:MAG TPA: ATP-binding cassette domain-containing protein [Chthoniobacterales bacterium]|jgi:phospholipid/cholesterol/gamma-HCH transport system ATP-binding protein|nr:ATP-binding cassette domain-containing protein [Chthoniobacterales bacterium]